MATRGSFGVGPQGPTGQSTGAAGGDLGGNYPNPTLQPTANVESIIIANSLDEFTPAAANINLNSHKITGLTNGSLSTDAAAFGQIPTTLPPSGSATGDLAGTYPAPTLANTANVRSVVRSNTLDTMGQAVANVSLGSHKLTDVASGTLSTDAVNLSQVPTSLPPNGAAGGDLGGTYPNPGVVKLAGATVSGTPANARVLAATSPTTASWTLPPYGSTGLARGGLMTVNGSNPAAFDVTAGVGTIADYTTDPNNPTITTVSFPAQTITISGTPLTRTENWWVVDNTGSIIALPSAPTASQRRQYIRLGVTGSVVGVGTIFNIVTTPTLINHPVGTLYDLTFSLGAFSINGNFITANGATLQIAKTAGTSFSASANYTVSASSPNVIINPAEGPATFRYNTQLTSSAGLPVTAIDPTHYDLAGVVTPVSGGVNSTTIHRVYMVSSGVAGAQLFIQYGQTIYTSLANAVAAIDQNIAYVPNPDLTGVGILIAKIAVATNCTSLLDTSRATIFSVPRFTAF